MISKEKYEKASDGLYHDMIVIKKNQETLSPEDLEGKYAKAYNTLKHRIWQNAMVILWGWLTENRPFWPGDKIEREAYYSSCKAIADSHMSDFVRVLYQHPDERDFYNLVAQIAEETKPLYSPYWIRECIVYQGRVYNPLDKAFWDEESQKWRGGNYFGPRWAPPIELRMQATTAPATEKDAV